MSIWHDRMWRVVILVAVLFSGFIHIWIYQRYKSQQMEEIFRSLETKVELARTFLELLPDSSIDAADLQKLARLTKQRVGARVTFIATDGTVIADSDVPESKLPEIENHRNRPEVRQALQGEFGTFRRFSSTVKLPLFYGALALKATAPFQGVVRLSYHESRLEDQLRRFGRFLWVTFLLSVIGFAILITLPAHRLLRELQHLTQISRSILRGETVELPAARVTSHQGEFVIETWRFLQHRIQEYHEKVRQEQVFLRQFMDALPVSLLILNSRFHLELWNKNWQKAFVPHLKTPEERSVFELLRLPSIHDALERVKQQHRPTSVRFDENLSGTLHYFQAEIVPLKKGEEYHFLIAIFDITQLRRAQAVRRDFVANVSHEMKTPLSALIGYADTLLHSTNLPPKRRQKFVERILVQASRLDALVRDLLILSQVEQGVDLQVEPIPLEAFLEEIIDEVREEAAVKGMELQLQLPQEPIRITGDRRQLKIALRNLLQNALNYSPAGTPIEIIVARREPGQVTVSVKDHGIGIAPKFQERIFQRFYRVDESRHLHPTGTGLGLAIAKHIVEAHGGTIGVESTPGRGSRFWLTLREAEESSFFKNR